MTVRPNHLTPRFIFIHKVLNFLVSRLHHLMLPVVAAAEHKSQVIIHQTSRRTLATTTQALSKMGRRPAFMNPALIEPDCELAVQAKKPRLTLRESTAMAALLSFRGHPEAPSSNVEAKKIQRKEQPKNLVVLQQQDKHREVLSSSHITDDEEDCSRSQVLTAARKKSLPAAISPPPLMKALFKPELPSFADQWKMYAKLPPGRPLTRSPGLAKHLTLQTKPICLKLSP
jgi:hypothetical protein